MYAPLSRRRFVQHAIWGALSLGAGGGLGGCAPFWQRIANRPTRRNIATLAPTDPIIQTYKDAVSAMKALPTTDSRNWTRQAQIHQNRCPHGNWYFLPWHRAYLFYFEEICRELTGNDDFALPYWNWTTTPQIPGVFWGGLGNPLFNGTRTATATSTASSAFVGPSVLEDILDQPNFLVFASAKATGQRDRVAYGELEGTPHNYVHGFVGGEMGTYMSPLDPVFWAHHNMIECCWVDWNLHRGHPNTNDAEWTQFVFEGNFVDRNGNPVDVRVDTTLLLPLLAYQYEDCFPSPAVDPAGLREFVQRGAPVRLEYVERVPLRRSLEVAVGQPVTLDVPIRPERLSAALAREGENRILLTIGDVTLPRSSEFGVHVFIGRPGTDGGNPERDPRFAGSFAFFVDEQHHPAGAGERPDFLLDVTETVSRLARANRLATDDRITVHLVPVPVGERPIAEGRFRLEYVEVGVIRAPQGGRGARDTVRR
jgi:tyrosinase